jgi:flagellar biosynthesis/type III secretory pathway protein FliH
MVSAFHSPGVTLFDEDFDLPPPPPEVEVIEPLFTAAELVAARDEAARDSRERALAEAEQSGRARAGQALTEIAVQLATTREEVTSIAERSAEAFARLLLDCFATAFPALSARHGPGELAAVLREILPALHREPKIAIRINPDLIPLMTEEIHGFDADLAARVRLVPAEEMARGDVRISWDHGTAARDAARLWQQIEGVLAPAGLLHVKQTVKEDEVVE